MGNLLCWETFNCSTSTCKPFIYLCPFFPPIILYRLTLRKIQKHRGNAGDAHLTFTAARWYTVRIFQSGRLQTREPCPYTKSTQHPQCFPSHWVAYSCNSILIPELWDSQNPFIGPSNIAFTVWQKTPRGAGAEEALLTISSQNQREGRKYWILLFQ